MNFSITVGISAYNEGNNIKFLLESVLRQKEVNFSIKKIIVVSDKSSDNTVKEAKFINDSRIIILENEIRMGKALSQNKILKLTKTDLLVLLDADILVRDQLFIHKLILPFRNNEKIGLVAARATPLPAENIFEKIINFSVRFKEDIYNQIEDTNNIFHCRGVARALSKEFIKVVKWPSVSPEDAYTYFQCKKNGLKFYYQAEAVVFYKSPQTFTDHLKQSTRFLNSKKNLKILFDEKFIEKEYYLSKKSEFKTFFKYFLESPFYTISYSCIFLFANIMGFFVKTKAQWSYVATSKVLIKNKLT